MHSYPRGWHAHAASVAPSQIPDVETGFQFRSDVYDFMNTSLPLAPPRRLLFFLRQGMANRRVRNLKILTAVADAYNVSYTYVRAVWGASGRSRVVAHGCPTNTSRTLTRHKRTHPPQAPHLFPLCTTHPPTTLRCRVVESPPRSFAEQFALFASHGIMVSPHSAGLTNTMLLPPGSAVIEMFPYHMHHALYPGIAINSGIANFPVHAVNGSIIFRHDAVSA